MKILSNPQHKFVKTLIYIYSMQSFVFTEMNKASRLKDSSKIELYGPLASALGFIVHQGNKQHTSLSSQTSITVYRGLNVPASELSEKYRVGGVVHLLGFTSTTLSRNTAVKFAVKSFGGGEEGGGGSCGGEAQEMESLLFEIEFTGNK